MAIRFLPEHSQRAEEHYKSLSQAVNALIGGKSANMGTFTLAASVTTTVVTDNLFESNQVVIWSPATANAAAAMTNVYLSARAKGSFTLTHSSTASTDRTYLYVRVG